MILKCTSFEQMNREITDRDMPIIIFGAGVIGTVTVPEILWQYDLLNRVLFYVDNCSREHGKKICVRNAAISIESADKLSEVGKNAAVIVAISRYAEVLKQLENMQCTNDMICYVMPMMCIHNFCNDVSKGTPVLTKEPIIPKRIHYMWLGKKPIPGRLQKCIDSWKRYCPDYEIIRWDESNYDISKCNYTKQAYEAGAYGFVPDYARLDILYQYGGIYMDTDVEVIRSLDDMLYQRAFCGVEKWQTINFGGCSGAVKEHSAIGEFLDERKNLSFYNEDGSQNRNTCGFYDTSIAISNGYQIDGTTQNILDMNIYAFDYFHPYDYISMNANITDHTYSVHWFNGGWLDENMRSANEKTSKEYETVYKICLNN